MENIGIWEMPFIAQFDTSRISSESSAENELRLPITSSQFSPITVSWGDGAKEEITEYNDPRLLHKYSSQGIYDVSIIGKSFGLSFANTGDRLKLLSISDWGGMQLMISGFHGCRNLNLKTVIGFPETKIKNLRSLFQDCTSLTSINNISNWDISSVPTLANMFAGATKFNQDISGFNFNINVVLENLMGGKPNGTYDPNYYDALLKKVSERVIGTGRTQANKRLGMGGCKFTAQGKTYRDKLIADGWTITDGGQI